MVSSLIPTAFEAYWFIVFKTARLSPISFAEKLRVRTELPKAFGNFIMNARRDWLLAVQKRLRREEHQPNRGIFRRERMKIILPTTRIQAHIRGNHRDHRITGRLSSYPRPTPATKRPHCQSLQHRLEMRLRWHFHVCRGAIICVACQRQREGLIASGSRMTANNPFPAVQRPVCDPQWRSSRQCEIPPAPPRIALSTGSTAPLLPAGPAPPAPRTAGCSRTRPRSARSAA